HVLFELAAEEREPPPGLAPVPRLHVDLDAIEHVVEAVVVKFQGHRYGFVVGDRRGLNLLGNHGAPPSRKAVARCVPALERWRPPTPAGGASRREKPASEHRGPAHFAEGGILLPMAQTAVDHSAPQPAILEPPPPAARFVSF